MTAAIICHGVGVNARTQCAHYHSERDLIGIQFKCCGLFYACFDCHQALADHPPQVWPLAERDTESILCGNCRNTLSISEYMACDNVCPRCAAAFNPGCAAHYHLYFEV